MTDGRLLEDSYLVPRLAREAAVAIPYCPYSGYPVQAAVAVVAGDLINFYHGANYEVITFNQTMHAEHSAITAALNDRQNPLKHRIIEAVYVKTPNGGPPCGHCRQIIAEFSVTPNIPVFIDGPAGVRKVLSGVLLPDAFDSLSDSPPESSSRLM